MYYLESVHVKGFWGNHDIELELFEDVNFLIGVNGSGKTTLLNLIASSISGNITKLARADFEKIKLVFASYKGSRKPSIEILKPTNDIVDSITFKIKDKASASASVYQFDFIGTREDPRYTRNVYSNEGRLIRKRLSSYSDSQMEQKRSLLDELSQFTDFCWLTVHRGERIKDSDRNFDSQVDAKLDEVCRRLIQFFGSLSNAAEARSESFQQDFLMQMLANKNSHEDWATNIQNDLEGEKNALYDIFDDFKIPRNKYKKKVDDHFSLLEDARSTLDAEKKQIGLKELLTIVTAKKLENTVITWKDIRKKRESIFRPRDLFFEKINKLLNLKEVFLDSDNEFHFRTRSEKVMDLDKLSSGEKQLLILFAESTLQKSEPYIYFADEPEISLHVTWQSQIVESLREINPNGQIVFATHSPDIVGPFAKNVHDMAKKVR